MSEPLLGNTGNTGGSGSKVGKILVFLVILGLAAAVITLIIVHGNSTTTNTSTTPALAEDVRLRIKAHLKTRADPCDDFYDYACGGWMDTHTASPFNSGPYVETFNTIGAATNAQLINLILDKYPIVGPWYESCVDVSSVNAAKGVPLKALFTLINRVAEPGRTEQDFWNVLGQLKRHALAVHMMLDWGVDNVDGMYRFLVIGEYTKTLNTSSIARWTNVVNKLSSGTASMTGFGLMTFASDAERTANIAAASQLAKDLAKLAKNDTIFRAPIVHFTPAELTTLTKVDFNNLFIGLNDISLSQGSAGGPVYIPDRVLLQEASVRYFEALGNLIYDAYHNENSTVTPLTLRTVLHMAVIESSLFYQSLELQNTWNLATTSGSNAVGAESSADGLDAQVHQPVRANELPIGFINPDHFQSNLKSVALTMGLTTREATCAGQAITYFDDAITHNWVAKYFPAGNLNASIDLVDRIHEQMGIRLEEVSWLDEATRELARAKWNLIEANVAYQTEWDSFADVRFTKVLFNDFMSASAHLAGKFYLSRLNTPAQRDHFPIGVDVLSINAYYYPSMNSINMLAGLMLEPVFSARYPDVMNLAAYGFVIGHEITHGFDNNGRAWNGTGFRSNWWTDASSAAFLDRTQCLIDQYNKFPVEGGSSLFVRGAFTLGENIADLGGMGLAWRVYKSQSEKPQYMAADGITNDQLFWIAAGQVWCTVATRYQFEAQWAGDVHAPGKYRINGPMSNLKGFADTWKCSASSPMGRSLTSSACEVW